MIKQILLTLLFILSGLTSFSQTGCDSSGYYSPSILSPTTYGISDTIPGGTSSSQRYFTIESHVRLDRNVSDSGVYQILSVEGTGGNLYNILSVVNDTLYGRIKLTSTGPIYTVKYLYPSDNYWHRVGIIYKNQKLYLLFGMSLVDSLPMSGVITNYNYSNIIFKQTGSPSNSNPLAIGKETKWAWLNGVIDSFSVSNPGGTSNPLWGRWRGNIAGLRIDKDTVIHPLCPVYVDTTDLLSISFLEGGNNTKLYKGTSSPTNYSCVSSVLSPCLREIYFNVDTCDLYTWHGVTYTNSTTASYTNSGCDTLYILNLHLGNSSSSTSHTVCNLYTWPVNGLTYTNSGTYTQTFSSSLGCDSILTINLVVNHSTFKFDTTVYKRRVCNLVTTTYPPPSFNPVNTNISTSGFYNLIKWSTPNSVGCDSFTSYKITFIDTIKISNDTLISEANSLDGVTSYQWFKCPASASTIIPGATNQTYKPTSYGSYCVRLLIGSAMCYDTTNCISWAPVGVNDIITSNFEIYPNPVNDLLNISSSVDINSVSITNIIGQVVFIKKYNNTNKLVLDMSRFEKGVYFVKVNNSINKILKQ